jgi:hypothetical protein
LAKKSLAENKADILFLPTLHSVTNQPNWINLFVQIFRRVLQIRFSSKSIKRSIFTFKKCLFLLRLIHSLPITVAARSKAWIFFGRSNAGIVGSNPT